MTQPGIDYSTQEVSVRSDNPVRLGYLADNVSKIVVNDADTSVWLRSDAGVAVGNGMVCKGRTSITWTRPGEMYAIREPDSDGNLTTNTVLVSSETSQWQPSPVDIGVAVATELAATGVLLQERSMEISLGTTDVSSFSSIIGTLVGNATPGASNLGAGCAGIQFVFQFSTLTDLISVTEVVMTTVDIVPVRIPVTAAYVSMFVTYINAAGTGIPKPVDGNATFRLRATSRTVPDQRVGGFGIVDATAGHQAGQAGNSRYEGTLIAVENVAVPVSPGMKRWFLPCYQGRVQLRAGSASAMNIILRWGLPLGNSKNALQIIRPAGSTSDTLIEVIMPATQGTVELVGVGGAATGYLSIHAEEL